MRDSNNDLKQDIHEAMIKHGSISILFYQMGDEWLIHKWGDFDNLTLIHRDLFTKYVKAGLNQEAESLALFELPNDEALIFRILTCGSLEKTLKEIGYIK